MLFLMFVGIAAGALFLGLFGGVTCGLLRVTKSRGLVTTYAVFMVVLAVGLVVPFWVLVGKPPSLNVFTIFLILGGVIGGSLLPISYLLMHILCERDNAGDAASVSNS